MFMQLADRAPPIVHLAGRTAVPRRQPISDPRFADQIVARLVVPALLKTAPATGLLWHLAKP